MKIDPQQKERFETLVEFHRSEAQTYAARGGQSDNPTAAQWLNTMAERHATWAVDIQTILRESAQGGTQEPSSE